MRGLLSLIILVPFFDESRIDEAEEGRIDAYDLYGRCSARHGVLPDAAEDVCSL